MLVVVVETMTIVVVFAVNVFPFVTVADVVFAALTVVEFAVLIVEFAALTVGLFFVDLGDDSWGTGCRPKLFSWRK